MHDELHDNDAGTNGHPLLLTASEAALLLHVSEKTLWNHTAPRGNQIPAVRFGKTIRYSREALERWIAEQVGAPGGDRPANPLAGFKFPKLLSDASTAS